MKTVPIEINAKEAELLLEMLIKAQVTRDLAAIYSGALVKVTQAAEFLKLHEPQP